MVCSDMIVAGESASFCYPPSPFGHADHRQVCTASGSGERYCSRLRYTRAEAAAMWLILESFPTMSWRPRWAAQRMPVFRSTTTYAQLLCNQTAEHGPRTSASSEQCSTASPAHAETDFVARSQYVASASVRKRDAPSALRLPS